MISSSMRLISALSGSIGISYTNSTMGDLNLMEFLRGATSKMIWGMNTKNRGRSDLYAGENICSGTA
jgi:hypothetical protein